MRESDLVLGADLLADDDLVDVVKLVPVFVEGTESISRYRDSGSNLEPSGIAMLRAFARRRTTSSFGQIGVTCRYRRGPRVKS